MSCTTILVGKNASYDGSTIIARNDDSGSGHFTAKKFIAVLPEEQPRHYRSVLSHVEIDLPDNPMRYTALPNAVKGEGIWAASGINEANVAMTATETITTNERVRGADPLVELVPAEKAEEKRAEQEAAVGRNVYAYLNESAGSMQNRTAQGQSGESQNITADTKSQHTNVQTQNAAADATQSQATATQDDSAADAAKEIPGGIGEEDLVVLVLPYIHSAREGVQRLGALLEQYGTYETNGIAFSDVNEIWWFESIGGHHWMARRVPDDVYVVMPNQLGIDELDLDDALGAQKDYMCSPDLRDFIRDNHLDLTMNVGGFNPRRAFGSHDDADHVYNTPRAWYMERYFNPRTFNWDGPDADYVPMSDDIPWSLVPEHRITIEDVKYILSSHYQGTPYDPYGSYGDPTLRGAYRSIGINRNDVLAILQIRPYAAEECRSVEWLAFGSNAFNTAVPFYTNVSTTPAYLNNTTGTVSTDNFYWSARLIEALTDACYGKNLNHIEQYEQAVMAKGHELIAKYDRLQTEKPDSTGSAGAAGSEDSTGSAAGENNATDLPAQAGSGIREQANEEIAAMLKKETDKCLSAVLFDASNNMKNQYSRSDH